jgi:geranylgeranyl pyrophosphate synthase
MAILMNKHSTSDKLTVAIQEINNRTLEKFHSLSISGVTDPVLLSVLKTVSEYWDEPFRPALTCLSCQAVGAPFDRAIDAGVMFTLVSAGFGMHDDIIDKTSKKHFHKTVLDVFGLDDALLAGDLLIVKGSTLLGVITQNIPLQKTMQIIRVFENSYTEICESEFMQQPYRSNLNVDLEQYQKTMLKSAADIEACTSIGALLGNGKEEEITALSQFGRRIGFYQRLLNDVIDARNIEGDLSGRLKKERIPLPILYASKTPYANIKIASIINKNVISPADVRTILEICFQTEAFNYIKKIAKKNSAEASQSLSKLENSPAKMLLAKINRKFLKDLFHLCL